MDAVSALRAVGEPVATRSQLLAAGATARALTAAVRSRALIRVREGYYALPGADTMLLQAVRIGGRLGCVSALAAHGVWVAPHRFAHVALEPNAARLRAPRDRFRSLNKDMLDGCELHWLPSVDDRGSSVHTVGIVDALVQTVRCQPRELAIAALDSALYEGLVQWSDVGAVFAAVPRKLGLMRDLVDGRCMSGIETIVRLILIDLGVPFEVQVELRGVGTVDFVVAGCVVIETDGHLGHDGELGALRDYARDVALIARNYSVLRLNFKQVMYEREAVVAAILGALRSHRRGPTV